MTSKIPVIVDHSSNYLKLSFDFTTNDWTGMGKYIIFHVKKHKYLFELDAYNEIIVPDYCLVDKRLIFSVYGEDNNHETRITCEEKHLILRQSGYTNNTQAPCSDLSDGSDMVIILKERVDNMENNIGADVKLAFITLANNIMTYDI